MVGLVYEELYIREDALAQQFAIRGLAAGENALLQLPQEQILTWLLQLIEAPGVVADHIIAAVEPAQLSTPEQQIIAALQHAQLRLNQIQERKSYLLIALRAKSEQLSEQVSGFVGGLQKRVSRQREEVGQVVQHGQLWIIGISLFLMLGLARLYWYSQRMTRDLQAVTTEMELLSNGQVASQAPRIRRNDEIGTLAKVFEVFRRDAIRRLEVTAELSEQKRLLETIFYNMNDGLSVFSAKGELLAWNRGYQQLFDLRDEDLHIGMPIAEVQKLIGQGAHKNLNLENQLVHMDEVNASRHHVSQSFERHFDSGKIIEFRSKPMPEGGFVTLYTDLTERKSVESQLRQAQKMEMLGQLTGGVAHDFNNLLAAIIGNLQMLSDSRPLQDDQKRYIERALAVSEKSSNLVQRLLAFGRQQQLFPERTHIDDLIEGMLDLVEYSVGNHIQVHHRLNCATAYCLIDPSQLENALLNLSLNSAQAMPKGGQLTFSTDFRNLPDSDIPCVRIKVEDTGEGIPKEVLSRIFEPFFSTKPVGKGSGLGLSMIYGFVKQSGGEIVVTSEQGQWTKVCIFLPIMTAEQDVATAVPIVDERQVKVPVGGLIWLVEDDPEVRRALQEQLQQKQFMVHVFSAAEEVINALEKGILPDLLLTDVNLSGTKHGIELVHEYCLGEHSLPYILMSGLPRQELEQKYNLLQTDLLISKPFKISQLMERLQII